MSTTKAISATTARGLAELTRSDRENKCREKSEYLVDSKIMPLISEAANDGQMFIYYPINEETMPEKIEGAKTSRIDFIIKYLTSLGYRTKFLDEKDPTGKKSLGIFWGTDDEQ